MLRRFVFGGGQQRLINNVGAADGGYLDDDALGLALGSVKAFDGIVEGRIGLVAINMPDGEGDRFFRVKPVLATAGSDDHHQN